MSYNYCFTRWLDLKSHSLCFISGPSKQVEDTANMKRENKAYSYKEQMAELELIKELEKKKGKKQEAPKLTKKQQEAKAAQIQKEGQIRQKLKLVGYSLNYPSPRPEFDIN